MKTLVGGADFEPTLPHGLFVPTSVTSANPAAYIDLTIRTGPAPASHYLTAADIYAAFAKLSDHQPDVTPPEPYRTTAHVGDPVREIEEGPQ